MADIFIIDDNLAAALQLQHAVRAAGFAHTQAFALPSAALAQCRISRPDVVLVDFSMPEMNGVSFIRALQVHAETRDIAAALVTGRPPSQFKTEAYEAGALDILTKPVLPAELRLKLQQLVAEAARRRALAAMPAVPKVERPFVRCLEQLAALHDNPTGKHTERIAAYAVAIGRHLGLVEAELLALSEASRLHDLGKLTLPDWLVGADMPLNAGEHQRLRGHTVAGYELLRELPGDMFQMAALIALNHHENWDGSGYPRGLVGAEIPLAARIVAVADAFECITTIEGHDPAWLVVRAQAVIVADEGLQFDPAVVASLQRAMSDLIGIKRHFDGDRVFALAADQPHLPSSLVAKQP